MDLGAGVRNVALGALAVSGVLLAGGNVTANAQAPGGGSQRPNIVMLMTDDTGWNDFGAYSLGGATNGHPTPNIDKMSKEGAVFTSGMDRRAVRRAAPRS
jgi:arylsulfatase